MGAGGAKVQCRAFGRVSSTAPGREKRYIGAVRGLPEQQGVPGRVLRPIGELLGSSLEVILGPSGLPKWFSEVICSYFFDLQVLKSYPPK